MGFAKIGPLSGRELIAEESQIDCSPPDASRLLMALSWLQPKLIPAPKT